MEPKSSRRYLAPGRLAGWPAGWLAPRGEPPSRLVFERDEYAMDVGERRVALQMRFSPDLVTGFLTDFAAFCGAADPDDPGLADLLRPQGVYSQWRIDAQYARRKTPWS